MIFKVWPANSGFWKAPVDTYYFNPLSSNSDQQQFSLNNIHTMSRGKVMRINKMIAEGKML